MPGVATSWPSATSRHRGGYPVAHRRAGTATLAALLALAPPAAAQQQPAPAPPPEPAPIQLPAGAVRTPVDPLAQVDDDFARNRDPALWDGLSVERIAFAEGRANWAYWRIVDRRRPGGILWAVLHDNENAAFDTALRALRRHGGVLVAVDTGPSDDSYAARFNRAVAAGPPIDPNRNFGDATPRNTAALLADLQNAPRLIAALHTNAPGPDPGVSRCAAAPPGGSGGISIRVCNDRYHPAASRRGVWPFDDADSMAILPYRPGADREAAFCAAPLRRADANIQFEHVADSDGSLSNYALLHGLRYVNFETRDRGNLAPQREAAQARLAGMIQLAEPCLPVEDAAPPATVPTAPPPALTPPPVPGVTLAEAH